MINYSSFQGVLSTTAERLCLVLALLTLGIYEHTLAQSATTAPGNLQQNSQTLTLEQALSEAVAHNFDLILGNTDVAIARTGNSWGATSVYPTFAAGASASNAHVSIDQKFSNGNEASQSGVSQSNLQAYATLNWKLFDGMKMFATKSRLEEIQRSGEIQYRNRVSQTLYDVSLCYLGLVRLHQQLRSTTELMSVLDERQKIAQLRYNVGSSAQNDVLQARIDYNEQRAAVLTIEKSIRQFEANLTQLLGRAASSTYVVSDSIRLNNTLRTVELRSALRTGNPSLLVARQDLSIALQVRREIASQGLPSVSINGGYSFNRADNSAGFSLFNQSSGFVAGIGVTIPLFNGMSTQTQLDVQDLIILKNEQQQSAVESRIMASFENALADYESASAIVTLQRESMDLAKQNSDIAMERFRRESITSVELRQIQLSVLQQSTSLYNTMFAAKAAELQLLLLCGQLQP